MNKLVGVCHQCLAGTDNCPYEDVRLEPSWLASMDTAPPPWAREPAFLRELGDLRAEALHFDSWCYLAQVFLGGLPI